MSWISFCPTPIAGAARVRPAHNRYETSRPIKRSGLQKRETEVRINRYTMTPDEDEDTTRYHFAKCSLLLRGLADTASQVFCEGRPISEQELRQIHADLNQVWHMAVSETLH